MRDIAVVGCGYWGKNLVRTFAQLGVLDTVCDMDISKVDQIVSVYNGVNGETNHIDVINRPYVKGVVVATPAASHYSIAKAALVLGKDVFVEKPFTENSQQAIELVKIAKDNGRILMVGHLFIYHPSIVELKRLIVSGELGEIYYMYATWANLGIIRKEESVVHQLMPHPISVFAYLTEKKPSYIHSHGFSCLQPGYPDVAFASFGFGDILAHVHVSWLDPHKQRTITIVGSKKMAIFDDMDSGDKLKIYDKGVVANTLVTRTGSVISPCVATAEPLLLECKEFIKCIKDRSIPISNGKSAIDVVKVLESVNNTEEIS
jgi:UDP-2-acetamido-3-amino-2,3-dideoxy-glucuronate N-acetyltransferase